MSTIRVAKRHRYTQVDRRAINDDRLSFKARGLLVWLLDKPDDWRVRTSDIARGRHGEGRDAIRAALKELETCGYLVRERVRTGRGRWSTETVIYEVSRDESPGRTGDGLSGAGEPDAGEPGANTNTVTDDCYPQTPSRTVVCMGCAAAPGAPCRLTEAFPDTEPEACPWKDRVAS